MMSDTIYEKNINCIKKRYPELAEAILRGREKKSELEVGVADVEDRKVLYAIRDEKQYQLDSLYDSEELMDDWYAIMENDCFLKCFVLFGLGNGMYVKKILSECKEKYEIIVMEPEVTVLQTALHDFDYTDIFSNENVYIYIPNVTQDSWKNFLFNLVDFSGLQGMMWGEYINYEILYPEIEKEYFDTIHIIVNAIMSSRDVQERFGDAYYQNIFFNYPKLIKSLSLFSLYENLPKDIPAVIVAAGPSLSKNIKELKRAKGKCLLIAADSALPALLKEDIIPDLYVCVDGKKNSGHFTDERTASIPAVIALLSATCAVKENQQHFFVSTDLIHLSKFMLNEQIDFPTLSSGGSVANIAFSLAVLMEIKTIILVGQDLAYTDNKTHADFTVRADSKMDELTLATTMDIEGKPILSSNEFILYKNWFEEQIQANDELKVIDATEGGALIKGSVIESLKDAIDQECKKDVDIASSINQCESLLTEEQQIRLRDYIGQIPAELQQLLNDCRKSLQNYEKMNTLAMQHKEASGEMKRLFKYNNELGKAIDDNPALCYVEFLVQDSIHSVLENAYKKKDNIHDEVIEASTIGMDYTKELILKTEWILEDLKRRLNTIYE